MQAWDEDDDQLTAKVKGTEGIVWQNTPLGEVKPLIRHISLLIVKVSLRYDQTKENNCLSMLNSLLGTLIKYARLNRFSPKTASPAFERPEVQKIMGDKALRDDLSVLAIRSNYCNVLFNLYRYEEAITLLKKLVVILEGHVYPTIAELKKKPAGIAQNGSVNFRQQVHQLVCNYYLLGTVKLT
jgi:hypothetical protein